VGPILREINPIHTLPSDFSEGGMVLLDFRLPLSITVGPQSKRALLGLTPALRCSYALA
jgi:hypothetical protein